MKLVQGDVKDYASVERAMAGQDAVLSALGVSTPLKRDPIVIDGVRNIVKAMEKTNVKRLVYLSFLGVKESREDAGFLMNHIVARIVHNEITDHEEKERLITSSRLAWTIVRPPKLTNGPLTNTYRNGEDIKPKSFIPTLSRADVADFMLRQLADNAFVRKAARVMH